MVTRDSRRGTRTIAAVVAATAGLSLVGIAGPAAAQSAPPSRAGICVRAEQQWARLGVANRQAKAAFARAQALQKQLSRAGRVVVAHRLDQRLAHLRAIHAALVARVQAVAARVQGRCSDRPPALSDF
jgi:hypothetical protein